MKKLSYIIFLVLLSTLAYSQCIPPINTATGQPANWPSTYPTPGTGPTWDAPDYFNCANYANSPLPKRSCSVPAPAGTACYGDLECAGFVDPNNPALVSTCSGPQVPNTGIRKFVDTLPGLTSAGANNLHQYLPVAVPDTVTYPGSDYYEIALVEYTEKMHSDLPPTKLRGYIQLNYGTDANGQNTVAPDPSPHYLGPIILAQKDRPVRVLFRNQLPTGSGGNLFVPVDTTVMGSGMGPDMGGMAESDHGVTTDGARNPMCGMDPKPAGCFTENRATLHLHGGITPWISDGTPHQWITPAAEPAAYPDQTIQPRRNEGVSVVNVPDMPDPGPGAQTFFYTNQQSARLMFYHDHAWGITRLNVYVGEAAGYVLTDATEQALMSSGALSGLGYGIPLIIQDRTFVPTPDQLALEDPLWDMSKWGGFGSLWVPHVYMPAQNPNDPTGMSGFGRWMYGPWFWPPANPPYGPIANPYFDPACDPEIAGWCQPPLIPGTPNQSVGMEHFNDTPIVNGTAYPKLTLAPGEYRFRILNAANDRFWNLQWYVADPSSQTDPNIGPTEVALKASEVAAAQIDPNVVPTPDTTISPEGPAWIQIGTEGGFLPAPVVIPNQVTTWVTDPTRFDVGNVDKHALLLAPAERADVVVDFTPFAGKTLILYNDAPAAFPARVAAYDYYTGAPDQTDAGGAPAIQPGYGPNTRTIMQVTITGGGGNGGPNYVNQARLTALQNAFMHHLDANGNPAGVFESSQDPIIVGQGAYNSAYFAPGDPKSFRTAAPRNGVARINDFSMTFNTLLTGNDAFNTLTIPFQPKALHDEMNSVAFDEYGRMTANIGLEVPNPTPGTQNVVLYPYVNPPTEFINGLELAAGSLKVTPIASANDGTQIWRITHNGVDTHPIHFHMFNVQLLNRVAWDNRVLMPDANELGWKDTVRVSPLQDTIVALRPIVPKIPFGVPDSARPLNPAMPLHFQGGFNNIDPLGNPINPPITNEIVNFGWEYVWHCHILGHEEMDMMRPIQVNVSRALPAAPVVSFDMTGGVNLSWTDGTPYNPVDPASWGDPANEIGFRIERADVVDGTPGAYSVVGKALANQTSFLDTTGNPSATASYRVIAYNAAGESPSAPLMVGPPILAVNPGTLSFGNVMVGASATAQTVTVSNTGIAPLTINGVALSGANFGDFAIITNNCSGASLTNGASCQVSVTFKPTTVGALLASLEVNVAAPATSQSVALNGTGIQANASVSPASLNFGNQTVNTTSTPQGVTLTNNGTATLTINSITVVGANFAISSNGCGNNLAAGSSCVVNVTFTPTVAGPLNASLSFDTSNPVNPLTVSLNGTGTVATAVGLNPTTLSFGNQLVGVNSAAQPVTLTNLGTTRLVINSIAFSGTNAADFTRTTNCPIGGRGLAAGASCNINVRFRPGGLGLRAGSLDVSTAGNPVASVALSGTGVQPAATVSPTSFDFGGVLRGQVSAPLTVTVTNTGTATLTFRANNAFTLGGANPGQFTLLPGATCVSGGTLLPGSSCTVLVAFSPRAGTARGVKNATLNIRDNAPNSPQQVALTGTAQ
jgi:FtsP/CotA-like multicopper oxidase with cupredoxin domain